MTYKFSRGPLIVGDISGSDDPERNTGIDFEDDTINLVTGGSTKLVIATADISSSLPISASEFHGDGSGLSGVTATASPGGSDKQIQFNDGGSTGGASNLYWDKTNNRVGVGTASPATNLHIKDTTAALRLEATSNRTYNIGSDAYGFVIWDGTTGGTEGYRFVISDIPSALGYVGIGAGGSIGGSLHPDALLHLSSSDDGPIFQVDDKQQNTLLFVTGSGQVGIGTLTPQTTLHVNSASNSPGEIAISIENSDITEDSPIGQLTFLGAESSPNFVAGAHIIGEASEDWNVGSAEGTALLFCTKENGTTGDPAERVKIDHDGKVGIGTLTPTSTLDVEGSVATAITTVNGTSTTVGAAHHTILMGSDNNNCTVTLPAANGSTGRIYVFKRLASAAATVKVTVQSGEKIDGVTDEQLTFDTQYDIKTVQSDGTQWWIIGEVHMGP